ncbi:MAG: DUF4082 domain-containing protein [Caldilineaceae bacterium]
MASLLCLFVLISWQRVSAQSPCANPIACENAIPGNPASEWDISGAGDLSIQGFATDISVDQGQTVHFKVNTDASDYRLDIYRMGYYGGLGARKITTIQPAVTLPQSQPSCLTDQATGLVDCGNWSESASWAVPATATSGIYFAKLVRSDTGGASHIVFIVRDDDGGSDLLFQTSDTTWQAYNFYGGASLYSGFPAAGRAYKVSYNRPFLTRNGTAEDWVFNSEYPMVRWLEANGYNVSYFTGVDSDRLGTEILEHEVFLSVGHDEYWSNDQRAYVETARAAGVNLAFFSGNSIFWKTRWENSIDGTNTPYRTLVSYKETHANAKIDPLPNIWTGTWVDPRFSPPADGGRPQNALSGTLFRVTAGTLAIQVPEADGKMRFWRNTSLATLAPGETATLADGTLGYEWDEDADNGFRPAGLLHLSSTTNAGAQVLTDYGSTYVLGTATHNMTLYRHGSGALVFSAGTIQWPWGLDSNHDREISTPDVRMQQATVNLFADMGVQPTTLQSGLVAAAQSTDVTAPTSAITAPLSGTDVQSGTVVLISGTAADVGGVVGGVEVSLDGGATWHPATGRANWSYSWTPQTLGTVTIVSRATDDSGNIGAASSSITFDVVPLGATCPCTLWDATTTPTIAAQSDSNALEVGVKFRSTLAGYITGIRFYKGTANTGTHTGKLWSSSGQLLATATFVNETASGWQQANFGAPVQIAANTTYVASYHSDVGHYAYDENYFATNGVSNGPLQALANGADGPNGVYQYGASAFPTSSYNASNYWVDVAFAVTVPPDTTPPTVTSVSPTNGTTNVAINTSLTINFSEPMDGATINGTTIELRDTTNTIVPATVSYNNTNQTTTLSPTAPLAYAAHYTATIKGGATDPRVKDLAGNALASDWVWSFTTVAQPGANCPCTIWNGTATPTIAAQVDPNAIEVGVKFQSDLAGYIIGLRFYKGGSNTGMHVGHLWSSNGDLLGSATFANETALGWQQVNFGSPIAINANTTYVASYHTDVGNYAFDIGYFATSSVDNPPLRALANGIDSNGVYQYGASAFPTSSSDAANYWVDVVFATEVPPDTVPPTVTTVTPSNGAVGVAYDAQLAVSFSEAIDPASIDTTSFLLRDTANNPVAATASYNTGTGEATLSPTSPLAYGATYTAIIKGGGADPRVKDLAGNALAADYTWSITIEAPPPDDGPGGPILIISNGASPFSRYYTEILRAEGLNAFIATDISQVSTALLASYDVVILGEMPLTADQVTMLTNWVTAGGNLIAMRPDKQLASLLGLTDAASTLSNRYLLINTTVAPGAGIVGQTIQFHSDADLYTLAGATSVATLYTDATTPSPINAPAITLRSVGANGGQAAAFTYDLARSIVYTRQGNPAWAGQERDGLAPIRSNDMFYGNAANDPQADWVDLGKVAIPQADEQQRLLTNLILHMNTDRKPLPRFWYFPKAYKAVLVMTGDDHNNGGTGPRFDRYLQLSSPNCSVADWECIRSTSYIYTDTPLSDAQAFAYNTAGFEIALHLNTGCNDYTPASLIADFSSQLASFRAKYTTIPAPTTHRIHCVVWSDWATQAKVALTNGIRFDTSYYYWPNSWVNDHPGFFTGSGMIMRFADLDGTLINVYQAVTQMNDEANQSYPATADTLFDRALGPEGYYGAFTANIHTDFLGDNPLSEAVINSAITRNIPVVSSRQMLEWLDGRNTSSFDSLTFANNQLSFSITTGSGAHNLSALLPTSTTSGQLTSLIYNGTSVNFTTATIKGVTYAIFPANAGSYQATYQNDGEAPIVTVTAPANGATVEGAVIVSANASDNIGVAGVQFMVDGVNWGAEDTTAPYSVSWTTTAYTNGPHTLTAVARDATGNLGTSAPVAVTINNPVDTTPPTVTSVTPGAGATHVVTNTTVAITFSEAMDPASINGTTVELRDGANSLVPATVSYDNANQTATLAPNNPLASSTRYTVTVQGGAADPRVKDTAGNALATDYVLSFTTTGPLGASCPCSIWDGTATPTVAAANDPFAIELGVKFRSEIAGYITGIRFYKGATNTGTHIGNLWSSSGELLATATFVNESASGWQAVTFGTPVFIDANTTYVASYHTTVGQYAFDNGYFASSGLNTPPLRALASGVEGGNGVYKYSAVSTFPTDTGNAANYWVDVVFATTLPLGSNCPCSIWDGTATPAVAAANDPFAIELGVKFRSEIAGYITGVRFYKGATNTGTHIGNLWSSSGELLATATFVNESASGWQAVTFGTPVFIDANTTYVASYHTTVGQYAFDNGYFASSGLNTPPLRALASGVEGGNGVYKYSAASTFPTDTGNAANYWVDVVFIPGSNCPCSIWDGTATPAVAAVNESLAIELGVKFRSEIAGYITGIRFYKGATNTGTHIGNLWSSSGELLATATFVNESASGWQAVTFGTPVFIDANTTYVASYHTTVGQYAFDSGYFASSGLNTPPLRALASGVEGGNGVYKYSAVSTFPTDTGNAANYWVDVVFATTVTLDTVPPTVTSITPAAGATNVANDSTVTVTFSELMDPASINGTTVELRDGANSLVPAAVSYNLNTQTVTLTPNNLLSAGARYTMTVQGGVADPRVKDMAGNALATDFSSSFTITVPSFSCPCSIWDGTATPAVAAVNESLAIELGVKFRSEIAGYITGIRFYKGATNTGTHIGNLWSSSGELLATATFVNESASGWQAVTFGTPVFIDANTTYVASYHTTVGQYAFDSGYFASSGLNTPPLRALASGVEGGNGVYKYSAVSTFPTDTGNAANYWVDVVFATETTILAAGNDTLMDSATDASQSIKLWLPIIAVDEQ